jgi:hypothetical protein
VGATATLTSECYDLSSLANPSLTFDYHMYGATMGSLEVFVNGDSVWTMSGNQGNVWSSAQVDLSAYAGSSVTIAFVGTRGTSFSGDMALDNIGVSNYLVPGCTDSTALNYNPLAGIDDGSCIAAVIGCMDQSAANFNALANVNDTSLCLYGVFGCMDTTGCDYNPSATLAGACDFSCYGCTDSLAFNYSTTATIDNGSCMYNDDCANAITIACGSSGVVGNNTGASANAPLGGPAI